MKKPVFRNPLNVHAKDLCEIYGWSFSTAKRRMREIRLRFNIVFPQTITYQHVAAFFGHDIATFE